MHSEYDFLAPYSRRLRRTAIILAGAGAVLAGAVSMALIVALPLQPRSSLESTASSGESSPAGGLTQESAQRAADMTVETATGRVTLGSDRGNPSTAGKAQSSLEKTSLPKAATSRLTLDEAAVGRSGAPPVPSPVQPPTDASVSSVNPSGAARLAGSKLDASRSRAEKPTAPAKRMPESSPPQQQQVRPEPFSMQEFLASHP
jgi:hypothetical protein